MSVSDGLLWAVGVTASSNSVTLGPARAFSVVTIGSTDTCTPGTFLYIKRNGNTIIDIYRPWFFSSDYELNTNAASYTLSGAYGAHDSSGNSFFGISIAWDGVSSGATICVYAFDGSTFS